MIGDLNTTYSQLLKFPWHWSGSYESTRPKSYINGYYFKKFAPYNKYAFYGTVTKHVIKRWFGEDEYEYKFRASVDGTVVAELDSVFAKDLYNAVHEKIVAQMEAEKRNREIAFAEEVNRL